MSNPFEEIVTRLTSIENRLISLSIPKEDIDLRYKSREETASILGLSLPTLNNYTKQGYIKASKIGNRVLYLESDIKEALSNSAARKYRRQ